MDVLPDDQVTEAVKQIKLLTDGGATVIVKIDWRTKKKGVVEEGQREIWYAKSLPCTEQTKLKLEFIERPGEWSHLPREDVEYFSITCRYDNPMRGTPLLPQPTEQVGQVRPRNETILIDDEDKRIPYNVVAGLKIPHHVGRHQVLYPTMYLARVAGGAPATTVSSEWKLDLQEWMASFDAVPRSPIAHHEHMLLKKMMSEWMSSCEALLQTGLTFDTIPRSMHILAYHITESILQGFAFCVRGSDAVAIIRGKMDTMWGNNRINYAPIIEQIMNLPKPFHQAHHQSNRPAEASTTNSFRGGKNSFPARR